MGNASARPSLHPPTAFLEPLDWQEEREERRKTCTPDKHRTKPSRSEGWRSRSMLTRKLARKVVKKEPSPSSATPSLGYQGENPGLLLSPLLKILNACPGLKKSPRKRRPSASASRPIEEVLEPIWEAPVEDSRPTLQDTVAEDPQSRTTTLQDVRNYVQAAGEK